MKISNFSIEEAEGGLRIRRRSWPKGEWLLLFPIMLTNGFIKEAIPNFKTNDPTKIYAFRLYDDWEVFV